MNIRVGGYVAVGLTVAAGFLSSGCGRDEATSANPQAAVLCDEGTNDLQAFRFQEAANKLGHCLEMDPSLAEAAISRTLAFINLRDLDNANLELARADSLTAEITNESRRMLAQLRLSRISTSRFHAMGDSLRHRMERDDPDNVFVLEAKAAHTAGSGDTAATIAVWHRILDINPNYAAAYNQLGYLEFNRGNYDAALDLLQKYIFLAPELANPHDSYGEVLLTLGRYEEAEEEFRLSMSRQRDFYPSLINLGRSYLARGKMDKGVKILNKVRVQVAGTVIEQSVDLRILTSYLETDQRDRLATAAGSFVSRFPQARLTPLLRSIALANRGHLDQGTAIMDSNLAACQAKQQYGEADHLVGDAEMLAHRYEGFKQERLGNGPASVAAWSRALELIPDEVPFHRQFFDRTQLAQALLSAAKPQRALQEIDPMLAVNPRLINVLLLKVQAHLDASEFAAAITAQEQLSWALTGADADYAPRQRATELSELINSLSLR